MHSEKCQPQNLVCGISGEFFAEFADNDKEKQPICSPDQIHK
jgi:hypothetical protein